MKSFVTLITVFFIACLNGQSPEKSIFGTYYSKKNGFERGSIMVLNSDSTFTYKYLAGGCTAEIEGTWTIDNRQIHLINDFFFTEEYNRTIDSVIYVNDTLSFIIPGPFYPDLSQVNWKYSKRSIKPLKPIDTGCLIIKYRHNKANNSR